MKKQKYIEHIKSIGPALSIPFFITISLLLLTSLLELFPPTFIFRLSQFRFPKQYSYILFILLVMILLLSIFCYFSKDRSSNNAIFIFFTIIISFEGIYYFLFYLFHYYLANINISLFVICLIFSTLSVLWMWGIAKTTSNNFFKFLTYSFLLLFLGIITVLTSLFISKCICKKNSYDYFSGIIASISIVITLSSSIFVFFKTRLNNQRDLIANARPIFFPNSSQLIKFAYMNNNSSDSYSVLKYVDAFYEKDALNRENSSMDKESEQKLDNANNEIIIHEQLSHQKANEQFSIKCIRTDNDYPYILKATDLASEDIYFIHIPGWPDIHLFNVEESAGNLPVMRNVTSNGSIYKNYKKLSCDWKQKNGIVEELIKKCFFNPNNRIEVSPKRRTLTKALDWFFNC